MRVASHAQPQLSTPTERGGDVTTGRGVMAGGVVTTPRGGVVVGDVVLVVVVAGGAGSAVVVVTVVGTVAGAMATVGGAGDALVANANIPRPNNASAAVTATRAIRVISPHRPETAAP